MPQVDLESLVCGAAGAGAGDRKVSCETVIAGDASPPPPPPLPDPDFPPESVTIRIGDEAAFSELNPIYERDDSTKGSTNPKSSAAGAGGGASNPVPLKARSNSTRVAGGGPAAAAATSFFGLPARIRRPSFTRRQPSQGRILPDKRSGGEEDEEPRSPKVSCIGKVLSDRERCGRRRRRRWWRGVVAVFRCGGGGCACRGAGGQSKKMASDEDDYGEDEDDEEPSIAGMRRFKSGRRAATWGEEAIAAAAAAAPGEAQEREEKHETEQWARLPVS